MTDDELASYLRRKINSALNDDGDAISSRRERNLGYYRGDLYGNEREGQSQVVTRECLEAVEWALPSIMRVFVGDGALAFEPVGPEDEMAAEQETEVLRHYLFEKENGFLSLHNWIKDALLYPAAYAKIWVEQDEYSQTEKYEGLTLDQVAQLDADESVEIIAASEMPTPMGVTYAIEIKRTIKQPCLKWEAVPGNEVLVDADATTPDLDKLRFVAHKRDRTYTELVQEGFDADLLKEVGGEDGEGSEEENRRTFDEGSSDDEDEANREYTVYECYVWVDTDGDGLAEQRRVVLIGDTVFENEEADYCPLVAMSAILMPHEHTGLGLVDLVADQQEISSALTRQLLTNIYRMNVPRKEVSEGALVDGGLTMDALLNLESEVIPVRAPGMINAEQIQPIAQHILPIMQDMAQKVTLRTGINPQLSLNPDVLREATKGAFNAAMDHASQRLELIVRCMAEVGIKQLFRKAHRLIREHMGQESTIQLRGEWVPIAPSEWRERNNIRIQVGVGNQAKEQKAAGLQQILALQAQGMQMGIPGIGPEQLYNTLSEMVRALGFRQPDRFFKNPAQIPPAPPKPDVQAEALKAQAEAMMIDANSKMKRAEIEGQKAQLEAQLNQAKLQLEQAKAQMDAYKAQQAIQADQQKNMLDAQIKAAELQAKQGDAGLKEAQRVKTLEEARKLDIENDATELGLITGKYEGGNREAQNA